MAIIYSWRVHVDLSVGMFNVSYSVVLAILELLFVAPPWIGQEH